jgi:hypothetical protein
MSAYGQSLETIVNNSDRLRQIYKAALGLDDLVVITTCNSVYKIRKKEENLFEVCGGWFDRKGLSPFVVGVRGCSWGGSIIKVDIIAACGLRLEFGNSLITSPIRKISVIKFKNMN